MARKGTEGFVTMTKSFEADMANCSLSEIGLMALLITSKATTPVGTIYRRFEWGELPGSSESEVTKLLDGLEAKGKIVRDHHDVLIRSWVRHRTFDTPNYLKACLYPLQVQVGSPLFRTVIASELLRKDIASIQVSPPVQGKKQSSGRTYARGRDAHYEALSLIWGELTGKELPPAETITGSVKEPNPTMVEQIMATRAFEQSLPELDKRNWVCIEPSIAETFRMAVHGPTVQPLRGGLRAN
ncbi:hypothetical protein [Dietzia sp. 179-F 9C3 NHS]|uniref:hypothetical protein n=1 Tax=Dietzia sp. 179-F 9C3 NHS TaxID=3374295 RepID=UPI00387941FA